MLAKQIIETLGGYREVAAHLGLEPQRVHNWTRRGVPALYWGRLVKMGESTPTPVTMAQLEAAWRAADPERRAA